MEQNLSPEQVKERVAELEEELKRLQSELAALRSRQLVDALAKTDGPLPP
jgi:prefoldin subunit 5